MSRWKIWTVYLVVAVLTVVRNDYWFWSDATLVSGIPINLFFHVVYSLVLVVFFLLLVRFCWPRYLDSEED